MYLQLTIEETGQTPKIQLSVCELNVCVQRLHHTEDLIKKWSFWACTTHHHTRHQGYSPPPTCTFHLSSLSPFLCLQTSQYIWLTWWTVLSAKLISFSAHRSHDDHLISASQPSAPNINLAWLTRVSLSAHTWPIHNESQISDQYSSHFKNDHFYCPLSSGFFIHYTELLSKAIASQ